MNIDKKILIVEDDALTAYWITTVLENMGYHVYEPVSSGEKAIEIALSNKPDLIFMDVWLTGAINGIDAAEKILSSFNTSIVFMSGYSESDLDTGCKKINYAAYLNKPLQIYDIEDLLKRNLS